MRVVLAMSGGVDSSVAAHLLLEQGHEVIGVFMRHGEQSPAACNTGDTASRVVPTAARIVTQSALPIVNRLDHQQGCCTAADAEDARRVADRLRIPFYALDLQQEFGRIMDYFAAEYTAGRTPNPCVQCNNWIKFGKLFDYADSLGAEYVATGHYARLELRGNEVALLRGVDAGKDQSYVLFGIDRRYLRRMLLPVGSYQKPKIRQIASGLGLRVAEKKDSQEICFVTSGRYDEFVRRHRGPVDTAGELVTTDGTVVGQHAGIEGFTVGQRKGLGVALGERKFVVRVEPEIRRVVLGDRAELYRSELTAGDTNWLDEKGGIQPFRNGGSGDSSRGGEKVECPLFRCHAQIRYNAPARPATVEILPQRRLRIMFDEPQFGVAPGQAVACFDEQNERVLGGGWIE